MTVDQEDTPAAMGLLNYLTIHSLDEDYAHVAQKRCASGETPAPRASRPGVAALVVLALFGALVGVAALQTSRSAVATAESHQQLVDQINRRKAQLDHAQLRVTDMRREAVALQATLAVDQSAVRAARTRITQLGIWAGSVPVQGPGMRVIVDDAPPGTTGQQVQDQDLQSLVNGLWQVGAEAVSINGQRITSLTSIRKAGQAITVNYRSLNKPYVVSAIGNPNLMPARFLATTPGQTWLALRSDFGLRFQIETPEGAMTIPAERGMTLRYATAHRERP